MVRVICVNLKLGGGSLTPALTRLGFKCYTFRSAITGAAGRIHPAIWTQCLTRNAKLDLSILENYDAIVGPPGANAAVELFPLFPEYCKVILVEEPDLERYEKLHTLHSKPLFDYFEKFLKSRGGKKTAAIKNFHEFLLAIVPKHKDGVGAGIEELEEKVKSEIPPDRLLVYRYGEGWEPLCNFLGIEEIPPENEFPEYEDGVEEWTTIRNRLIKIRRFNFILRTALSLSIFLFLANFAVKEAAGYEGGLKYLVQEGLKMDEGELGFNQKVPEKWKEQVKVIPENVTKSYADGSLWSQPLKVIKD